MTVNLALDEDEKVLPLTARKIIKEKLNDVPEIKFKKRFV